LIKLKEGVQIPKEVQKEEARRIEETYKSHLEEKQCIDEIASLRKEAEQKEELKENKLEAKFSQQERKLKEEIISLKIQLEEEIEHNK
jgi:hypothetical protein